VKIGVFAIFTSVGLTLAACGSPAVSSGSYPPYSAGSYDNASSSSSTNSQRQARLTSPTAKPTLDTLPGMTGAALTSWLGAPQFRRQDGQAEIWQYRAAACTLDIFLYSEGGDLRVRYVEARNHATAVNAPGDPAQARACASALINARAGTAGPG
jgi:hypothetical protein